MDKGGGGGRIIKQWKKKIRRFLLSQTKRDTGGQRGKVNTRKFELLAILVGGVGGADPKRMPLSSIENGKGEMNGS